MPGFMEKLDRRAENMARMMDRLGVDGGRAWTTGLGIAMGHAARRCAGCGAAEECSAWLEAARGQDPQGHRRFCPNAEAFETLTR